MKIFAFYRRNKRLFIDRKSALLEVLKSFIQENSVVGIGDFVTITGQFVKDRIIKVIIMEKSLGY